MTFSVGFYGSRSFVVRHEREAIASQMEQTSSSGNGSACEMIESNLDDDVCLICRTLHQASTLYLDDGFLLSDLSC